MTLDRITQLMKPVVAEFTGGALVWNRASGKRGVIVGYVVYVDGSVSVKVDYGGCISTEMPAMLIGSKISDGTDGDEWKEGAAS